MNDTNPPSRFAQTLDSIGGIIKGITTSIFKPESVFGLVIVAVFVLFSIGFLISTMLETASEIAIGLAAILGVSTLLVFLFILAAGYSRLKLADSTKALGLPEGSVRALIALFLILMFIFVGIYLFRQVSYGTPVISPDLTLEDISVLPEALADKIVGMEKNRDGTFDVTIAHTASEAGIRASESLISTIGTLLVAIAGFYFGTKSVSVALPDTSARIASINPSEADDTKLDGEKLNIVVDTAPVGLAINHKVDPPDNGTIERKEFNVFEFTPSKKGPVKLTFTVASNPTEFKQLKVNVIKKLTLK